MKKPSLLIIFLTVFIDLIGFGIVLPLLPIFARNLEASGFTIGILMASYSLMQFVFAPIWGKLSDRIGRRPVLLVSTAGAAISYAVFAIGSTMTGTTGLIVLFVSRAFAGVAGANITVAQAYIADITPAENRSRKMGLIGMAFGFGFIFGPAIGGFAMSKFGLAGPGWVAAGFCALNFVFTLARLPESRQPSSEHMPSRPGIQQWTHTMRQPKVGLLVVVYFLATLCFTCFETTIGLLVSRNFHINLRNEEDAKVIAYLFAYCGLIGAFVQGGAIGRLVKKLGEPMLIAISLIITAASLAPIAFITGQPVFSFGDSSWQKLLLVLAVLSIGSSLTRPPLFGLISILTPANEQGATIGVAQGAGSLARIIGPIFAASLFDGHPAIPYVTCAAISFLTGLIAWQFLHKRSQPPVKEASASV